MSDKCERLFSSCKILLKDHRSRLRMDIVEANECLQHSYGRPQKGVFNNQVVGEVEGEPATPLISPLQASAARKAAEALTPPPTKPEDAWGFGFEEEFNAIEEEEIGSKEEPTPGDGVVVINDDEIIEEGNKETNEQI